MKFSIHFFYVLTILLFLPSIMEAKNSKVTERIAKGKALQSEFPDEMYISLNNITTVDFILGKKKHSEMDQDGKLQIILNEKNDLIALSDNQSFSDYQVYSLASKIHSTFFTRNKTRFTPNEMTDNAFENDGIFHSDYRYRYYEFNLGPLGEQTNIQTKNIVYDSKYIDRIFFHENYAIKNRKIIIDIPKWMEIEVKEFNFDGFGIRKSTNTVSKNGRKYSRITYQLSDAKKINKGTYKRPKSFTYPHLIIISKKYTQKEKETILIGSTEQLYKWYHSLIKDLEYGKENYTKKAQELTATISTDEAKIKAIYYWIQDNIRYIAFENGLAGFKPMEAHHVFENRYGDCKGMANLCKAMLKSIGLEAKLTWIGTSSIPYDYSLPSLYVDNHMICSIELEGKTYFLDPTEKNQAFGENAYRIRGRPTMIENSDNKALIKYVPDETGHLDSKIVKNQFVVTTDLITGKGHAILVRDEKNSFLYGLAHRKKEYKVAYMANYLSNVDDPAYNIYTVVCNNCQQRESALNLDMQYKISRKINEFDGEVYMEYAYDKELIDLKLDSTQNELAFQAYYHVSRTSTFEIPNHWKLKFLPGRVSAKTNEFEIDAFLTFENHILTYSKTIKVPKGYIGANHIDKFKLAHQKLKEFYLNNVIFTQ
ncbi:MAG: hypothetical protein ACJAZ2_001508 [Glaciecola sp.]|jgi:hypothetical protein